MLMRSASIAATCVLSLNAAADLIAFTNTNPTFTLSPFDTINDEPGQALDITKDIFNQPAFGAAGPAWKVWVEYIPGATTGDGNWQHLRSLSGIAQAATPINILDGDTGAPTTAYGPRLFNFGPGDRIGPACTWTGSPFLFRSNQFGRWDSIPTGLISVGVRIVLPDGIHYGFVDLERFTSSPSEFRRYRPVYWGYETVPNKPIGFVPAPAGVMALSAIGLVARRR